MAPRTTTENDASDSLEDPERVYNGNETSFSLCPTTGRLMKKKRKQCYSFEESLEIPDSTVTK